MKNACENINPSSYFAYAADSLENWKKVVDQQVIHWQYKRGVISRVEQGPDGAPRIWVRFQSDDSERKFQPNAFDGVNSSGTKFFSVLTVPSELLKRVVEYELHREEQTKKLTQARKKKEQQRERLEQVVEKARRALANEIKSIIPAPHLNAQDIQLALEWSISSKLKAEITPINIEDTVIQGKYSKDWELGRVLSARAAEKAAMKFYQDHGFAVEDVSATQIAQKGNDDWKCFDLKVNGNPVDVKNSRSSRQNEDRYVEHCVPKSKLYQNQPIEIAGVLSPYLWPCSILRPADAQGNKNTSITFLGTTTLQAIRLLKQEFEIPGIFEIDLGRSGRKSERFIPPWMFDYPDSLYERRNQALAEVSDFPVFPCSVWREYGRNPLPIYLAAGIRFSEIWTKSSSSNWRWSFVEKVIDWRNKFGLSLPFLFLSILTHFLQMIYASHDADYRPRDYLELLYFGESHAMPLFIHDPLKTIYSLITNLGTLWTAEHGLVRQFRLFQLRGLRILRGRTDTTDKKWKTLIAYCGGWIDGKGRCDKTPLILGERTCHCPECGRLICPECQFCAENCAMYKERKPSSKEGIEQVLVS